MNVDGDIVPGPQIVAVKIPVFPEGLLPVQLESYSHTNWNINYPTLALLISKLVEAPVEVYLTSVREEPPKCKIEQICYDFP